MGFMREAEVVHQELDGGARDRNGAFESVDGLAVCQFESVKGRIIDQNKRAEVPKRPGFAVSICKR